MKRDPAKREQWREWIAQWRASGKSAAEFGREHGVTADMVYWWRRELDRQLPVVRKAAPMPALTFVQVPLQGSRKNVEQPDMLEVVVTGERRVRIPETFSASTLQAVVRALEAMR